MNARHAFTTALFRRAMGPEQEKAIAAFQTILSVINQKPILTHLSFLGQLYALGIIDFLDYQRIQRGALFQSETRTNILSRLDQLVSRQDELAVWVRNLDMNLTPRKNNGVPTPYRNHGLLYRSNFSHTYIVALSFFTRRDAPLLILKKSLVGEKQKIPLREQFSRTEAFAGYLLPHSDFVSAMGYRRWQDTDFILMPALPYGWDLDTLSENRTPPEMLLRYFSKATDQITLAHQLGILNFDIKPDNIYVVETGDVYIFDFGLSLFHVPDRSVVGRLGFQDWYPHDSIQSRFSLPRDTVLGTAPYIDVYFFKPTEDVGRWGMYAALENPEASTVFSLGISLYSLLADDERIHSGNETEYSYNALLKTPRVERLNRIHPQLGQLFTDATALIPADRITLQDFRDRLKAIAFP